MVVAIDHAFYTEALGSSEFILANVNIRAKAGELVVVYGKAGAGKSTLLTSLLGEAMRVRGHVFVSAASKFLYCSEEPWLQTLSVRDNILFGAVYIETKYYRVLDACCLIGDLNALPDGEDTMVGPKGINYLGDQNARVALVRALYSDADLLVLDCPLAGADAIVQSTVFRKSFLELLRNKTVILATHNPEIMSSEFVDRLWHVDAMSVTEVDHNERHSHGPESDRTRRLVDVPPWRATNTLTSTHHDENGSADLDYTWAFPSGNGTQLQVSKRTIRRSRVQQTQDPGVQEGRSPFFSWNSKRVALEPRGWMEDAGTLDGALPRLRRAWRGQELRVMRWSIFTRLRYHCTTTPCGTLRACTARSSAARSWSS